jgi:hypothetical protein
LCFLQDSDDDSLWAWKCVDHKLQLAVLDAFGEKSPNTEARDLICRVRGICTFIRLSANRRILLKETQSASGHPVLVPKLDCPTRWSSVFMMLDRFLKIYPDIQVMVLRGLFDDFEGIPVYLLL